MGSMRCSQTLRLCSGVLGTVVYGKVLQDLGPGNEQKEVTPSFDQVMNDTTQER